MTYFTRKQDSFSTTASTTNEMIMMAMMINDSNPIRQRFDRGGWKKERGGECIKYYLLPHGREKLYQLSTSKNKKKNIRSTAAAKSATRKLNAQTLKVEKSPSMSSGALCGVVSDKAA